MPWSYETRKHKKRTQPAVYLRETYQNMSKRVRGKIVNRPNYAGMSICTRDEFVSSFINECQFLSIYKLWQASGYSRGKSPSIDRINPKYGYQIWNMQFLTNNENKRKQHMRPVIYGNKYFESIAALGRHLGKKTNTVHSHIKANCKLNGKEVSYAKR